MRDMPIRDMIREIRDMRDTGTMLRSIVVVYLAFLCRSHSARCAAGGDRLGGRRPVGRLVPGEAAAPGRSGLARASEGCPSGAPSQAKVYR